MAASPTNRHRTMPKNKRPVPRKSSQPVLDDDERLAQTLADLALDLAEQAAEAEQSGRAPDSAALSLKEDAFDKLMRNALRKKNDELLYGAIERARETDVAAWQLLRERIEDASATVLLRREGAPALEVNAFALPLFVYSSGGLKEEQTFNDQQAFARLSESIVSAALESPQAKVVLISHAYDLGEFERLTYSALNDMVREAGASMSGKKLLPTPALERSMAGWAPTSFGAQDRAVELRFLLGFALKRADDGFYQVPQGEAEADAYFEARMERFRAWTGTAAPLVAQCLSAAPETLTVNFLYQDLPFGACRQAVAELAMLGMLASVGAALDGGACAPDQARVVIGPADVDHEMVWRVNLYGPDGALVVSTDLPFDLGADLRTEVEDIGDALAPLGIAAFEVARRFDADGSPVECVPWTPT